MSDYLCSKSNVGTMAPNEIGKEVVSSGRQPRSMSGLPQRIADCDPATKEKIRQKVKNDIFANPAPMMPYVFFNFSIFSFLLPEHWGLQPADFVKVLERAFIDINIMKYFNDKRIINWSDATVKLYPLKTTGDGNCLMHAISLFLWGIEDLDLQMRRILYQDIFNDNVVKQYRKRWQLGRAAFDQGIPSGGLRYNTMNWDDEWKLVVRNSSPEPNPDGQPMLPYHSLEEIHVFIMANILRRPIIVLADTMFRDFAGRSLQPQNVTGIYLPVLCKPEDCCHNPIVLGYHQNHFVPLIGKKLLPEENVEMVLPLCNKNFEGFSVHYLLPDEDQSKQRLLDSYLNKQELPVSSSMHTMLGIPTAVLGVEECPESVSIRRTYFKLAEKNYQEAFRSEASKALIAAPPQNSQFGNPPRLKLCCMCNENPTYGDNDVCKECLMTNCTSFHPSATAPPESMPIGEVSNQLGHLNLQIKNEPESELRAPPLNPSYKSPTVTNTGPLAHQPGLFIHPQMQLTHQRDLLAHQDQYAQQGYSVCMDKPCKTPACHYFCSSQLPGDYCHNCNSKMMMNQHIELGKCRTEGCLKKANPERQGLCDICSETQHYKMQGTPQVIGYGVLPSNQLPTASGLNPSHQERPSVLGDPSGLDSLAILQTTVGSKKCNEPTCKLTGQDDLQGFCRKCYDKNISVHRHIANIPQVKTTKALRQSSMEGVKSVSGIKSVVTGSLNQHYSEVKPSNILCKTENCELYGTEEQGGYCSKCLEEILLKDSESRNVCKSRCCGKKRFKDGYCRECYEHTPNLSGGSLPSQSSLQSASVIGREAGTLLMNTCITNGCGSVIVTLGDGKHCYECHQRPLSQNELSEQLQVKCVYPKCSELTPKNQPICFKCQSVLDANRSEQTVKVKTVSPAPSAALKIPCTRCPDRFAGSDGLCNQCRKDKRGDMYNPVGLTGYGHGELPKCRNQDCDMHGTAQNEGYCSKCFNTKQKKHTHSQPITPSPRMLPKEEPYKNRRCAHGCGNWANVQVLNGLCNDCYRLYKNDYPGRIAQTAKVREPTKPILEPRNKNRTDQNCFNPECSNRGNPRSQGFCNSCYKKLHSK